MPEQPPAAAPIVNIAAAEPPVLNVTLPDSKQGPKRVRVEFDERGNKSYVSEPLDD